MSAASTPAPRDQSSSGIRYKVFWPVLIVLLGLGTLEVYHVTALEDELDKATRAVDLMDGQFKRAQYEKAKFEGIAGDLLRLAPNDPNAKQIAVHFNLRPVQAAQPAGLPPGLRPEPAVTNAAPVESAGTSYFDPVAPSQATNAQPNQSPASTAK